MSKMSASRVFPRIKESFPLRLSVLGFLAMFACGLFSFFNLTHWDGEWYRQIVDIGYSSVHSADRFAEGKGNVGFFPGYPLAAYLVKKILGLGSDVIPTTAALLITSNLLAILTWVYLLKWLELFQDHFAKAKMILLAIYPYTFFLYCAYTESMFTSMILGFFYFTERWLREEDQKKSLRFLLLAILHGFFMNFTRLVGLVMIVYPVLRALQTREKVSHAVVIAFGSILGTLVFFLYCQLHFGAWNFYFTSEAAIWGIHADFSKLFPPQSLFNFARPFYANTVSKYVTIFTGVTLTWKLLKYLGEKAWRVPGFAVLLCAGMMWGECLIGRTAWDYAGMGRYMIPVFAIMLPFVKIEPKLNWKWVAVGAILLGFEIAYALKFGRHGWVA